MSEEDLYGLLGVDRKADESKLKQAYRKLARELHPDRNPNNPAAEDRFKKVSFAFEVLSDLKKRNLYDEFGLIGLKDGFDPQAFRAQQAWQSRGGASGSPGGGPGGFEFRIEDLFGGAAGRGSPDFSEMFGGRGFEELFGQRRRTTATQDRPRKADVEVALRLSLAEALRGCQKEVRIGASGASDAKQLKVRIPAGIAEGGKVRLRGQGAAGGRGKAGDLILKIHIDPHPHYWREDNDLHVTLPVTVLEAYRGTQVSVPTLEGSISLRVPAGTQSGAKLRARGKGLPDGAGKHGDLIGHVQVKLPPKGVAETEALLEKLASAYQGDLREEMKL